MCRLTTHVLDTSAGRPGAGIGIEVFRINASGRERLASAITNADGRIDGALLDDGAFTAGVYELVFAAGDYFRARGVALAEPAFLDAVVIRFGVASPDQHYHVPLLISPYGYSTYRGS
jgi:5-hydroxyisourate hydrolase